MTMTIEALRKRLDMIQMVLTPQPRTWLLVVEEGKGLRPETLAQIGPKDTVIIQEYPVGYFGEDEEE